jgi:hypothetical protein
MNNPKFVALTRQSYLNPWDVVAWGDDRGVVQQEAARVIVGDQVNQAKSIEVDTELKNLIVVPFGKVVNSPDLLLAWSKHEIAVNEGLI